MVSNQWKIRSFSRKFLNAYVVSWISSYSFTFRTWVNLLVDMPAHEIVQTQCHLTMVTFLTRLWRYVCIYTSSLTHSLNKSRTFEWKNSTTKQPRPSKFMKFINRWSTHNLFNWRTNIKSIFQQYAHVLQESSKHCNHYKPIRPELKINWWYTR